MAAEPLPVPEPSPERTPTGLRILALAVLAGLAGDGLLRCSPWGVDVPLWLVVLLGGLGWVARTSPEAPPLARMPLMAVALGFGALVAWHDSSTLACLEVLAVVLLGVTMLLPGQLDGSSVWTYVLATLTAGVSAGFGALALVFADVRWRELPRDGMLRHALAVARGLAIAVPLLLVFGALLTAADAVYEGLVTKVFDVSPEVIIGHVFLTAFLTWIVAGYARAFFQRGVVKAIPGPGWGLGAIEIGIALGLLDLLFLTFVVVLARYFFGGSQLVMVTQHLSYADYARRGFFELVTVVALALPVLLAARALYRPGRPWHDRLFTALAGIMVALLAVIMTSALMRMQLYTATYGLTETRYYTTAFMGWLALALCWFVATALRGRPERFATGALASGLAVIVGLAVNNPSEAIARVNLQTQHAVALDTGYLLELGADAVPALVEHLPSIDASKAPEVARSLLDRYGGPETADWRSWNWGRARARALVQAHRAELEKLAPRTPAPPGRPAR